MKTLLLLRHAKSSWKEPGLTDFERPLNERGRKAAPFMGRHMRSKKLRPDLVLCSPAERTRQTVALLLEAAGLAPKVRYDERIYEATPERLIEVVSQVEDSCETVLLVGHNPGMEELISALTGATEMMPTAALARISLDVEKWEKLRARCGKLEWVARPKEVMGDE